MTRTNDPSVSEMAREMWVQGLDKEGNQTKLNIPQQLPACEGDEEQESLDLETRKDEMNVWGPHRPNSRMTDACVRKPPHPLPLAHAQKHTSTQMHSNFLPILCSLL